MAGKGGRYCIKQQLSRLQTAADSTDIYLQRLEELYTEKYPNYRQLVKSMVQIHTTFKELLAALKRYA